MAQRTISTRLAIEGEAAYKQSIANINREYKVLDSSLQKLESEFKGNANSMEALRAKGDALNKLYENQEKKVAKLKEALANAEKAQGNYANQVSDYKEKITAAEAELDKLKNSTGDTSEEQKKLTEEIARLQEGLVKAEASEQAATAGVDNWKVSLNKAERDLNNLGGEIKENNKHLDEAKNSADGCATSIDRFGKKTKEAGSDAQKFGKDSSEAMQTLSSAIAAAGIVAALEKIVEGFKACIDASIEFESAVTGVAKTTDLTETELAAFSDSIKTLSGEIPLTTTELAGIAETAGQLGISGSKNLLSFTKTMAELGTATNMTSEDAATMLAQFANITGMPVDKYENLGSAITALGNTSATTESKITDMSQGMAASASLAGFAESDILAYAAAVTSLGIETQAGSTAMSTLISTINMAVQTGEGLNSWAQVAGMTAEQFKTAWGQDAAGALNLFIQGLNNTERNGKSAESTLKDLGVTETRMTRMTLSLANSGDLLSRSLDTSKKAFADNTALAKEASTRYGTTESKVQLMNNAFNNLKIAVGDKLNPAMSKLTDIGTDVAEWAEDMVEQNDALVPTVTALTLGLGAFTVVLVGYTTITPIATKVTEAFNAAQLANPYMMVVAGIAALVTALSVLILSYDDGIESSKELTEASRNAVDELENINTKFDETAKSNEAAVEMAGNYVSMLKDLEAQGLTTTETQTQYKLIVDQLNGIMPELNLQIDEQTHALKGGTEALEANIDQLSEYYRQQAYMEKYGDVLKQQAIAELEVAENMNKRAETEKKVSELESKRDGIIKKITKRTDELTKAAEKQSKELGTSVDAGYEYDETLQTLYKDLQDTNDEFYTQGRQLEENDKAIETSRENYNTLTDAVDGTKNTLDNLNASQTAAQYGVETLSESQLAMIQSVEALGAEVANLQASYDESYAKAYESISGQIGLFQEMDGKAEQSIGNLIGALDSQISYMDTYASNIQKAMELGVDKGLIAKLSDGSEQSAKYLAAIVADGGKRIPELNEKFGLVEEGKEKFATQVATMETEFDSKMTAIGNRLDELVGEMDKSAEAGAAARQTGDSYATGLRNKYDEVYNAGAALASAANRGWKDTYVQHSPAKLAIHTAEDTGGSYVIGLDNKVADMEKEGEKMATATNDAYMKRSEEIAAQNVRLDAYADMMADKVRQATPTSTTTRIQETHNAGNVIKLSPTIKIYSKGNLSKKDLKEAADFTVREIAKALPGGKVGKTS